MPILNVELIGPVPDGIRRGLASRIADATGHVLNAQPRTTWVKVHFVEAGSYAENTTSVDVGADVGADPVIVSVLQAEVPQDAALADQVSSLTRAIAAACARPVEAVHLICEPAGAGRVFFGGKVRR